MSLPAEVVTAAEAALRDFCSHHSSPAIADQVRYAYEINGLTALLLEQRPGFMNPSEWSSFPVAKFRYAVAKRQWSLYWSDSNGRWRRLSNVPATDDIRKLIKVVADDPLSVFLG
ncbi:MAG: DUF3024 domain-containing protein [Acidobacteriota bacterium]